MDKTYKITIAGLERELVVCKVNESFSIAAFILFGDVEMTVACAKELLALAPPYDIIITAEAKGIPLAYEMARQGGNSDYIVARKVIKVYMSDVFTVEVQSMTTRNKQSLHIDGDEAERMKGKRVLIVDDVISTGESLNALEVLVNEAGGLVAGKMAVLAEGDAKARDDIIYLEYLPLLSPEGLPLVQDDALLENSMGENASDARYVENKAFWDRIGKIEELNVVIGLNKVDGQKELYEKTLMEMTQEYEESAARLMAYLDSEDLEMFHAEITIMRECLSNVGATELSALAFDLEIAAASDDEMFCIEQLPAFLEDLDYLFDQLKEAFLLM